ncbi:hypothetical protein PLICRDRAFT_39491 [Plicaturopsis crispa FD-325 SS-3]|nr:hypothetical protein PLICRDRAFT_39491 [Plicaturopsis crispa FD-325 SS-3]
MSSEDSNVVTGLVSSSSFDEFNAQLQGAALKAIKNSVSLPSDLAFHRSIDSELAKELDAFSSRVLSVTNDLLALVSTVDASQAGRGKGKQKLQSQDDVVDRFESLIVESMDQLLERADMSLDEYLGKTKAPAIAINPPKPAASKNPHASRGRLDPVIQHASHIPKPQAKFKTKADNSASPWYPRLDHKYNAQVPLGYIYQQDHDINDEPKIETLHPYRYEIKHITYPSRMFQPAPPTPPRSFEETPFTWVDTPALFNLMLEKLRLAKDIAVDLEHHSYRSFSGFLCLMQISTREEDYIVDCLVLRDELVELNEIFTNPEIVKVFHGAESDIVWLQQNFNLFIVNLFDTFHASKILEFPRHGLANLLEMYCDFTPDKRYQLADWRIRPLPEEMLLYARSDTHFLLYIYDNLRNALLDLAQSRSRSRSQSPTIAGSSTSADPAHVYLREALSRSEETALRTYEKEMYDLEGGAGPGGWDTLARKWNKSSLARTAMDNINRDVYRCVHGWRDQIAREEDESTRYVLPNHFLFQLAETPPADMAALMSIFQSVPPVLRRRARELLDAIKATVQQRAGTKSSEPMHAVVETNEKTSSQMDVVADSVVPSAPKEAATSQLWSHVSRKGLAVASSSSLFGVVLPSRTAASKQVSYAAPKSSLFGGISPSTTTRDSTQFRQLVSRIHSTLVIAPSVPKIGAEAAEAPSPDDTTMEDASSGHVEMPFVPATQRKKAEVIDDSIVVVGQARAAKRKRTKSRVQDEKTPTEDAEAEEVFDYSAVPNILDDAPPPEAAQRKKKKQKQNKGGIFEYGNFPAPPKAHSELRNGNQSHTFK